VALTAACVIGFAWMAERNGREVLTGEIETRLLMEARNLALLSADALLSDFPELTLYPLVREIQAGREDIGLIVVLDHEGKIMGFDDLDQLGRDFTGLADLEPESSRQALRADEALLGNAELLVASVPVVHKDGQILGRVIVGFRKHYLDAMVARLRDDFVLLTGILLAAGIASILILMSLLLRPVAVLRRGLERIGRGDLDTPLQIKDRTEFGLLAESVNGMARQLKAGQTEMLEKERLDHEMDLAHSMQQSLLPEGTVRRGELRCSGTYRAATKVGGDFFDVFDLPDDKVGVVIADVSGKGLRGCLVTSMLAVLIRSLHEQYASPSRLLIELEQSLGNFLAPGMFVTIFYGTLDPASGAMTYASAAHCPLLIHRARSGQVEWYRTKGIPLGAVRGGALARTLEDQTVTLDPGDTMLLYTDGLNEAWHPQREEEFGFERIAEIVAREAGKGGASVLAAVERAAREWTAPEPAGDDLTLLVIERAAAKLPARYSDADTDTDADSSRSRSRSRNRTATALLHEMLVDVHHLELPPEVQRLERLRSWLEQCPEFLHFSAEDRARIESGLFEVCSNLIEHGFGGEPSGTIELWWLPTPPRDPALPANPADTAPTEGRSPARNGLGYFIICDQGRAWDPHKWTPPDLLDPAIRRRGRGFGLSIVHSSTGNVVYSPSTPAGNLTMLRFNSHRMEPKEDCDHVESIRH